MTKKKKRVPCFHEFFHLYDPKIFAKNIRLLKKRYLNSECFTESMDINIRIIKS